MAFSKEIRDALTGTPFGAVYPTRVDMPNLPVDGRTVALRLLALYLSEITFQLPGDAPGKTRPFRVPFESIHIEQPDAVTDMTFPSIAFIATAPATYDAIGLTTYVDESSRDKYGRGTVLQVQSEYREEFIMEVWANKRAERRALLSGIEVVMTPTEQMAGLRFRMKDFYDQNVCFMLNSREIFDDQGQGALGRRRARFNIEMRFNVVVPVNYNDLRPEVLVQVDADAGTGEAIELDDMGPSVVVDPLLPGEPPGRCCGDD